MNKPFVSLRSFLTAHPLRGELYIGIALLLVVPLTVVTSQNNQDIRQNAQQTIPQIAAAPTYYCIGGDPCNSPVSPKPECTPRPSCLDSNPQCAIGAPPEGWCPNSSITPIVTQRVCDTDAKKCPDGSVVGRSGPNCEFVCPKPSCTPRPACLDSNPRCLPPEPAEGWCPNSSITPVVTQRACTSDAMQCPDGSWVGRSGPNCEFVCPKPTCTPRPACLDTNPQCLIGAPPEGWCPKPSLTPVVTQRVCDADAKKCPDGSVVGRSGPNCEFATCPATPTTPPSNKGNGGMFAQLLELIKKLLGGEYWNKTQAKQITNYEACAAAGYPIMEKYPPVCVTPDGKQFTQKVTNPPVTNPPVNNPQDIKIKGELTCLPHKDQSGPQTMECAFGLRDAKGTYYALRDTDPGYKNVSQPTGKQYEAVGKFTPQEDTKYPIIGTIEIQSLTPIK